MYEVDNEAPPLELLRAGEDTPGPPIVVVRNMVVVRVFEMDCEVAILLLPLVDGEVLGSSKVVARVKVVVRV